MSVEEVSAAVADLLKNCKSRFKSENLQFVFRDMEISATALLQCVASFVRSNLLKLPQDPLTSSMIALGAAQSVLACSESVKMCIQQRQEHRERNNAALIELKRRISTMTPEQVEAVSARSRGVNLGMMRRAIKWKKTEEARLLKEAQSLALVRAINPTQGLNTLERIAHIIHSKPTDKEMTVREITHVLMRSNQAGFTDQKKVCEKIRTVVKKWKGAVFTKGFRKHTYRLRLPIEVIFIIRYRGMPRELLISMGRDQQD
ncbi:SipA N-terminal domain-like superfamily protein [Ranid herpesvirus 3]|uniref:SipA N-terminal domain-like superfamily protein n=1 Tax=Ranid herpesvirus 3 TaxID=1987509 RepID=A0A1X9T565_9VIRU|nr:SipA N-terminal domain-like superfamily protein [Ranid herpesvirus 3]ARR28840.1 SipA N-terminal domain-like superfamily protein [Ranid herpesvirus 3]